MSSFPVAGRPTVAVLFNYARNDFALKSVPVPSDPSLLTSALGRVDASIGRNKAPQGATKKFYLGRKLL
jgi:hypothetical protein